jgi:hypothetical protein
MENIPKSVEKWYRSWIGGFPKSWHSNDVDRFYMFTRALLKTNAKNKDRYWIT